MRSIAKAAIVGVAGWISLACGSDPSTIASEQEAKTAYAALDDQLILVSGELVLDAQRSGTAELPCEGGGTSKITVSASSTGAQTASGTQRSTVSRCTVGALTMDGQLDAAVNASGNGQILTLTAHLEGTVTFAGEPDGVCYVDVTIEGTLDEKPRTTGTICGFPAEDILEID